MIVLEKKKAFRQFALLISHSRPFFLGFLISSFFDSLIHAEPPVLSDDLLENALKTVNNESTLYYPFFISAHAESSGIVFPLLRKRVIPYMISI